MLILRAFTLVLGLLLVLLPVGRQGLAETPAEGDLTRYEAVARAFEQGLIEGDRAAVVALMDVQAIATAAMDGIDLPTAARAGALRGIEDGLKDDVVEQWSARFASDGDLELLGVRDVAGEIRALFRILPPDGGLSYLELIFGEQPEPIRVIDIFDYSSGQRLTEILHQLSLAMFSESERTNWQRLTLQRPVYSLYNMKRVRKMAEAVSAGLHREALRIYNDLPLELKQQQSVLLLRLQAVMDIDESEYLRTLEEYKTRFPESGSGDLISIDYYFLKGDYEHALESIDNLYEITHDPYLYIIAASVNLAQGALDEARAQAEWVLRQAPELVEAYDVLLAVAVAERRYDRAVRVLAKLDDQGIRLAPKDLSAVAAYQDFLRSPEYAAWLDRRSAAANDPD